MRELYDGNGGEWGVPMGRGGALVGEGNGVLVCRAGKLTDLFLGCLFRGKAR